MPKPYNNDVSQRLHYLAKKLDRGIRFNQVSNSEKKIEEFAVTMKKINELANDINELINEGLVRNGFTQQ